jgi:hypothetical protein
MVKREASKRARAINYVPSALLVLWIRISMRFNALHVQSINRTYGLLASSPAKSAEVTGAQIATGGAGPAFRSPLYHVTDSYMANASLLSRFNNDWVILHLVMIAEFAFLNTAIHII